MLAKILMTNITLKYVTY